MNESSLAELQEKVAALEERLDRVETLLAEAQRNHNFPQVPQMQAVITDVWEASDRFSEVRQLVNQGKKIDAIKKYRELTGVGLAEAKDAVDAM